MDTQKYFNSGKLSVTASCNDYSDAFAKGFCLQVHSECRG